MIVKFIEMLAGAVFDVIGTVFSFLPQMPFGTNDLQQYMNDSLVVKVIQWMNFFLPLDVATAVISVWAAAMMTFIGVKLAVKYGTKLG